MGLFETIKRKSREFNDSRRNRDIERARELKIKIINAEVKASRLQKENKLRELKRKNFENSKVGFMLSKIKEHKARQKEKWDNEPKKKYF